MSGSPCFSRSRRPLNTGGEFLQLVRLFRYPRPHRAHALEVVSLHFLRHPLDAFGCQQLLADRVEQNRFDSIAADTHGVSTCATA